MLDLYTDLRTCFVAEPDRRGECHIKCPHCGKEPKRGQTHASFNENGYKCFVCGEGGSLKKLAKHIGIEQDYIYIPKQRKKPKPRPDWLKDAESLVSQCENHRRKFGLWALYKPIEHSDIVRKRLGVGVLPSSRCRHDRLIVPVIDNGKIVGMRGRAINCDCGKWLVSAGTPIDKLPLYNDDSIRDGDTVWIVENPIDALMVSQMGYVGVATYSVSYWRDGWLNNLRKAKTVVVAYDNDLPGNGGARNRNKFVAKWLLERPGTTIPPSGGIKLANTLLEAGINAVLYDWGRSEEKADIGSMLDEILIRW